MTKKNSGRPKRQPARTLHDRLHTKQTTNNAGLTLQAIASAKITPADPSQLPRKQSRAAMTRNRMKRLTFPCDRSPRIGRRLRSTVKTLAQGGNGWPDSSTNRKTAANAYRAIATLR